MPLGFHSVALSPSQGCFWYSFELDTVVNSAAHFAAMGLPRDFVLEELTEKERRSLVGEAFGAPCVSKVMAVYYANPFAPWWRGILSECPDAPCPGRQAP